MTYTIVQIVTLDETGDTLHRMKWPAHALVVQDPSLRVLNVNAYSKERYELGRNADLLVLFQSNDSGFLEVIAERRKKGLRTLVEYNDNFYSPQAWSPIVKEWSSVALHSVYETFMRECDGILVTGPGLFELFNKRVTTPIHVLENNIYFEPPAVEEVLRKKTSYPSFGWAGSLGHIADLLAAKPIIEEVLDAIPGSIFHVMGNVAIPEVLGIPKERISYTPWAGMKEYFAFWEPLWVGIAPMLKTEYNRCRSDIKIVEMGACGVAPVVSPTLPYKNLIDSYGVPNAETFEEFSSKVTSLLKSSSERISLVEGLWRYIITARQGSTRGERLKLYRSLLPEKPSSYSWATGPGYHEIQGEKDIQTPLDAALIQAQSKIKANDLEGAVGLLFEALKASPYNQDIHLNLCKLLIHMRDERGDEELRRFNKNFPMDIRGRLLGLRRTMPSDALISEWRQTILFVRNQTEIAQNGWSKDLCELMAAQLQQNTYLAETAEELLLVYPYKHSLRAVVAQVREKLGNYAEAHAHFTVLSRTRRNFDAGDNEIAAFEHGYLEAMRAAMEARKKGTLS